MEIKTKYNIGDEVWFNSIRTPKKGIIIRIECTVGIYGESYREYRKYQIDNGIFYDEQDLFPTKEELLKSLQVWSYMIQKSVSHLKKQIEETDSIKKRHILINKYLAERIRRVEVVMTQEFPDEVSYEEMIECLWEDLKLAQKQIIYTYSKLL